MIKNLLRGKLKCWSRSWAQLFWVPALHSSQILHCLLWASGSASSSKVFRLYSHLFPTLILCYIQSGPCHSLVSIPSHLWANAPAHFFFLECCLFHYRSQIPLAVNGIFPWPSTMWGSLFYFLHVLCTPRVVSLMFWLLCLFEPWSYHSPCFRLYIPLGEGLGLISYIPWCA